MAVASIGSTSGFDMSSFDEERNGVNVIAAVVLRRGAKPEESSPGPRMTRFGMLLFFWRMRISHWLGIRLDPSRFPFEPMPNGYNSATGRGEDRILFSSQFRHVRYRGATYPLTDDGSARVVLIDERGPELRAVLSSAVIPAFDRPRTQPGMDKRVFAQTMAEAHRRHVALVNEALRADPMIREFISAP